MQLLAAHQILIASGIFLSALMALRGSILFAKTGSPLEILVSFGALLTMSALIVYFRKVRTRYLEQKRAQPKR